MSRSYREPYCTSEGSKRKWFKTYANRVARRHRWNIEGLRRRLMYKWSIDDFGCYWDTPENRRK
jgi:hypothetical protein